MQKVEAGYSLPPVLAMLAMHFLACPAASQRTTAALESMYWTFELPVTLEAGRSQGDTSLALKQTLAKGILTFHSSPIRWTAFVTRSSPR